MTTQSDGATAQNAEQNTSTEDAVRQAAEAATANSENDALEQRLDQLLETRLDRFGNRITEIEKREQGRAQQFWNTKLKEDRDELAQFMGDVSQVLDEDQREQLDAIRENRRRQMLEEKLERFERGELQAPAAQQAAMSQSDVDILRSSVETMLDAAGITGVDVTDSRLWQGYSDSMSAKEALAVARRNLASVRPQSPAQQPAQQPAPTQRPQEVVPPTTANAPATPADDYASLGDLAVAFRDRQIDSSEYSRIARERNWL